MTARPDHPQNGLTWEQAREACAWLGSRMPSEAEWEYAATGPVHRKYPWGDKPEVDCDHAIFDPDGTAGRPWGCDACAATGCSGTLPVGSRPAGMSWSGALDMAGNVWEWNEDWYHPDYSGAPGNGSAWVVPTGTCRILRGGGFPTFKIAALRSSWRDCRPPTDRYSRLGVRCVRDLPITCGTATCPVIGGYKAACKAQKVCEYTGGNGSPMAYVPAGAFWMGANKDGTQCPTNTTDSLAASNELPCHQVAVPGFLVDTTEATVDSYVEWLNRGGAGCSKPSGNDCVAGTTGVSGDCAPMTGGHCNYQATGKGSHPVNCVDYCEAKAYCAFSGKRLCSEAEWEKAARGTSGDLYPWGDQTATCQYAVMNDGSPGCGGNSTMAVGSKSPAGNSPYGAQDMAGNVFEWVDDDFHGSYAAAPTNGSAWVDTPRSSQRVVRGGGFVWVAEFQRASYRISYPPSPVNEFIEYIGIRCCRTP